MNVSSLTIVILLIASGLKTAGFSYKVKSKTSSRVSGNLYDSVWTLSICTSTIGSKSVSTKYTLSPTSLIMTICIPSIVFPISPVLTTPVIPELL